MSVGFALLLQPEKFVLSTYIVSHHSFCCNIVFLSKSAVSLFTTLKLVFLCPFTKGYAYRGVRSSNFFLPKPDICKIKDTHKNLPLFNCVELRVGCLYYPGHANAIQN